MAPFRMASTTTSMTVFGSGGEPVVPDFGSTVSSPPQAGRHTAARRPMIASRIELRSFQIRQAPSSTEGPRCDAVPGTHRRDHATGRTAYTETGPEFEPDRTSGDVAYLRLTAPNAPPRL